MTVLKTRNGTYRVTALQTAVCVLILAAMLPVISPRPQVNSDSIDRFQLRNTNDVLRGSEETQESIKYDKDYNNDRLLLDSLHLKRNAFKMPSGALQQRQLARGNKTNNHWNSNNIKKLLTQTKSSQKSPSKRSVRPAFLQLCETERKLVLLNDDLHEYQPSHYTEVWCKADSITIFGRQFRHTVQKCGLSGDFRCIQQYATVFLVKHHKDNPDNCWQSEERKVPYGCDCMWPVAELGMPDSYEDR